MSQPSGQCLNPTAWYSQEGWKHNWFHNNNSNCKIRSWQILNELSVLATQSYKNNSHLSVQLLLISLILDLVPWFTMLAGYHPLIDLGSNSRSTRTSCWPRPTAWRALLSISGASQLGSRTKDSRNLMRRPLRPGTLQYTKDLRWTSFRPFEKIAGNQTCGCWLMSYYFNS